MKHFMWMFGWIWIIFFFFYFLLLVWVWSRLNTNAVVVVVAIATGSISIRLCVHFNNFWSSLLIATYFCMSLLLLSLLTWPFLFSCFSFQMFTVCCYCFDKTFHICRIVCEFVCILFFFSFSLLFVFAVWRKFELSSALFR